MDKTQAKQRIGKLKELINHQRYLYHVKDTQELSSEALDCLRHELYLLEQQYPDLVTADSPTQRVAGAVLEGFSKVKHKVPMISLEDSFSESEMQQWQDYLKKLTDEQLNYFCELKIDGFAISLIYKNGKFVEGSTRGDGKVGEDVTLNLKTIESIPLSLELHESNLDKKIIASIQNKLESGEIEVRGEVYMNKDEFERINQERIIEGNTLYANPRNLAAGSIRQLDPKVAASRKLSFLAYDLVTDFGQTLHSQDHQILTALGFRSEKGRICQDLSGVFEYYREVEKKREKLPFLIDGVVVNVDDNRLFQELGVAGKAPRAARAFKFSPEQATTIVEDIKVQVGRTGTITPVAHLKPVEINGVMVKRATLHNLDQIERLGVKIGDTVVVDRAGDVIPAITKVILELRSGKEKNFKMPEICPVCHTKLIRPAGEVAFRCPNAQCPARTRERLYHFVSRKAFNIDGLGPEIIDQLVDEELVIIPPDLFKLKKQQLLDLERFADKSASNLIQAIDSSKKIALDKFIFALGIRHIGENTAEDLAKHYHNIENFLKATENDLQNIDDVGPKMAQSIVEWLSDKDNQAMVRELLAQGIEIENPKEIKSKIKDKTFVITGSFDFASRDEIKDKLKDLGAKISESVSKKTDYVMVGSDPGSKFEKAKELGITIIGEKEFKELTKG